MRRSTWSATAATMLAVGLLGCGSRRVASHQAPSRRPRPPATVSSGPARLAFAVTAAGQLPAAVADAAAAPLGQGRFVLLGGLLPDDTSTASIVTIAGGNVVRRDELPVPQHDAQAARIGAYVYVFGGGEVASFDHILRYDPRTGAVAEVGTLPTAASDVAVAALGQTAYVVGGYDGAHWLDSILAWRPGTPPRLVARLPSGLRYAALAAAADRLIIVGGTTPTGVSDSIFSFDPATGTVKRIGRLPVALTHASAASADGAVVVVVGGRRSETGDQTDAVLAVDPVSGAVRRVARLPEPVSDASVVSAGSTVVVAGGQDPAGARQSILALTATDSGSAPR